MYDVLHVCNLTLQLGTQLLGMMQLLYITETLAQMNLEHSIY